MQLLRLFRSAGATGHVFLLNNGHVSDKGLAYSGLIGPMTTVAVVPATPQIVNFSIDAKTKDKQGVAVNGTVTVTLTPAKAISKFDFTVDARNGGYIGNWGQVLQAKVVERVLRVVLAEIKQLEIEPATHAQATVEDAIKTALGATDLTDVGISVDSCSITVVEPADDEVANAIGSSERQTMLALADSALHERRMKAATNDRTVKEYEAGTKLELERKQGELIVEQTKNEAARATSEAAATEIRLKPLETLAPGKLLAVSLLKAAESGRMGSIAITTEMLAAVGGQNGNGHVH